MTTPRVLFIDIPSSDNYEVRLRIDGVSYSVEELREALRATRPPPRDEVEFVEDEPIGV